MGGPDLDRIGVREPDRRPGHGRHLACQADHAQRVAAVRLHVDIEHDVAVQVRQRDTERRVGRQDEDAVRVGREVQLVARAQHAVADDAHLLGPLDAPIAGQDRARQRDRDALAGGDVRGATDDLERLAIADRDACERQPVGARMALDAEQLADDDVLPVGAPRLHALDFHPEQRQPFGQLLRRELDVDVVAQP